MAFRSVVANVPMAGVTLAGLALVLFSLTNESFIRAQSPQTAAPLNLRLPDETAGGGRGCPHPDFCIRSIRHCGVRRSTRSL